MLDILARKMRGIECIIVGALTLLFTVGMPPVKTMAYETNVFGRDPSTVVKDGNTYWVYTTGRGAKEFSSADRIHWTEQGSVFAEAPDWVSTAVPANMHNSIWAPDIHFWGGLYHLYYSYSSWGSDRSAIGTATNPDINNPRGWTDQGMVVNSPSPQGFNTIDPCIFVDSNHNPWLSFGSYFSGIFVAQIDPVTGKVSPKNPTLTPVAARSNSPGGAIEASCVYYHAGYYYLFVNWGSCCSGDKSTYNIRIGRSRSVTGPYIDKSGVLDMRSGGGTLFLGSVPNDGSGRPFSDEVGPGHAGILIDGKKLWFSYHEEWAKDNGGATALNLSPLDWDSAGWPILVHGEGPFQIISWAASHEVLQDLGTPPDKTDSVPSVAPSSSSRQQEWTIRYEGNGYYALINSGNGLALTAVGSASVTGMSAQTEPFKKSDGQLWYLQQNDDGTYTLLSKSGGNTSALSVDGSSVTLAPREHAANNGADNQKWLFKTEQPS